MQNALVTFVVFRRPFSKGGARIEVDVGAIAGRHRAGHLGGARPQRAIGVSLRIQSIVAPRLSYDEGRFEFTKAGLTSANIPNERGKKMSAILTVLVRIDRMNVKRYEMGIFHPRFISSLEF